MKRKELLKELEELRQVNLELRAELTKREYSEEMYHLLLDTMTEGVGLNEVIFNESGEVVDYRILEVNKAFYSTADYSSAQVIGNLATKLYGMSEETIKSFWKIHKHSKVPHYSKMVSPLGKKCFLISTSPLVNNKFATVFFDITGLERAEQKLKESEELFRSIFEYAPLGVITRALDGRFLSVNQRACEIFGYSREELLSMTFQQLTHPDFMEESLEFAKRILEGKILSALIEKKYIHKDGRVIWGNVSSTIVRKEDGSPNYFIGTIQDITEQKTNELTIQQKNLELQRAVEERKMIEDEFERFFNLNPDLCCIASTDAKFLKINSIWETTLGYAQEELISTSFLDFVHPDDIKNTIREVERQSRGEKVINFQNRYRCKDGSYKWMDWNSIPSSGAKPILYAIARDITKQKQIELELIESENRFKSMFEKHNAIMILIDPQSGSIIDANKAATKFYGYAKSTLCSMNISEINILPSEQLEIETQKALNENRNFFIYPHKLANGEKRIVEIHMSPIHYKKKKILFSIIHDITERKQAEFEREQSFKFFQTSSDIMCIADPNGAFMKINPACSEILGYSESDLISKPFVDFIVHEDKQRTLDEMAQQIQKGYSLNFENRYMCKDGSTKWLSWRAIYNKEEGITYATARDITKQKKSEEEILRLSAERRTILDNIGSGIFFLKNRNVVWANQSAASMYKYTLEEIVGGSTFKFHINKEAYDRFGNDAYSTMALGLKFKVEVKQKKKTGEEFWCYFIGQAINPNNLSEGSIWIAEDITLRKQMEEKLKAASIYARSLIEASLDPLVTINSEGKITDVNLATEKVTGISREKLIGTDFLNYFTEPEKASLGYKKVFEHGYVIDYPLAIRHSSGKVTDVLYNASLYKNERGEVTGIFAAARDITERKIYEESLKKWEQIFKYAEWGIVVGSAELKKMEIMNPAFARMHGYTIEELKGQPILSLYASELHYLISEHIDIAHEKGHHTFESIHVRKDGTSFPAIVDITTVKDENGIVLYRVVNVLDITERKKAEEKINLQNKELAALNASKDKFFSIIAHDLRSPFTGFLGLTQLLKMGDLTNEQVVEYGIMMNESAQNLFKLLENLLTWARMQRGAIEFKPTNYALSFIINPNLTYISESAKQKNIEIINNVSDSLDVFADSSMLNTVIRNLLSNAVKFTNRSGKVIISAEEKDKEILVSIQDTGIGMDSNTIDGIFRIDRKTTRPGTEGESSTGLGLLLCKEFIEKHGGKIWVEGEVNKGSTFYFTLKKQNTDTLL